MKSIKYLLCLGAVLFVTACSNGLHVVDLKSPVEVVSPNSGRSICIADVTDNRIFNGDETRPNLPSGEILSKDYKARAYARLKNTLQQQSGAMLLPEDKTVASLVKNTLKQALSEAGFNVVDDAAAEDQDTVIMAVSVKQFWTWSRLDKVNDDIVSDIELDIYTQDRGNQKHINLKNSQRRKVLTDTRTLYKTTTETSLSNIYHLAVEKFSSELK